MPVVVAVFDADAALVESPLDEAGLRLLDGRAFVVDERLVQGHIGLLAVEGFPESAFRPSSGCVCLCVYHILQRKKFWSTCELFPRVCNIFRSTHGIAAKRRTPSEKRGTFRSTGCGFGAAAACCV